MAALFGSILSTLSSSLFRKEASHTVVDEEPVRESPKPSPNRKASSTMAGLQKGRKYRVHISGGTNLLIEWRDDEGKAALEDFILPKSQSIIKSQRIKDSSTMSSTQLGISSKERNGSEDMISKIQPCQPQSFTPSHNVIPPYFNANTTSPVNTVIPLYVLSNTAAETYLNVSPSENHSIRKSLPHRIITLQTILEDPLGEEEAGLHSPLDSGVILSDTDTDSDSARSSAIEPPKTPDPTAASVALHASARQAAHQAPKKPRRTNVRGTLFNTAPVAAATSTAAANATPAVLSFVGGGECDIFGEGHYSLTKEPGQSSGRRARCAKEADDVFAIENVDVGTDRTAIPRAVAAEEGTLEENKENVDEDGSVVC